MGEQFDLRVLLVVIEMIAIIVSVMTNVLKKVFWCEIPTKLLVIIVSEGLTLSAGLTYAVITGAPVLPHHILAAIAAAQGIAYAAMFGYDQFIEIKRDFNRIRGNKNKSKNV